MRVTILGCGTSGGVPRLGGKQGKGEWGAADPSDPRNRRRRCSILVQDGGKTVLVDTSPDVRSQLLDAEVERVDAVIWTHEHADQVHGIDDLRPYAQRQGQIEAWADRRTLDVLMRRFGYVFETESIYHALYDVREIRGPFAAAGFGAGADAIFIHRKEKKSRKCKNHTCCNRFTGRSCGLNDVVFKNGCFEKFPSNGNGQHGNRNRS